MKNILILIVLTIIISGCSKDESELKIRLSNVSQYDFKNIVVNTSTGIVNFEDIKSGQTTEYQIFDMAYRYAFVELEIDGKTYTLLPIDYVGESLLENGNYTYQLDANDTDDQFTRLSLTLIKD